MKRDETLFTRRQFLGAGAATLAAAAAADTLLACAPHARRLTMARSGIGYFSAFGVTEELIRHTLAEALSRGGDFGELFFQHRVTNRLGLEDGKVDRAFSRVELGVGIRVVRGDQIGYAYTEDFSPQAMRQAARTAAAIAEGPARKSPPRFHLQSGLPQRYRVERPWEEVRPDEKLPLLMQLNERAFAADPRIQKVSVSFGDESGVVLIADSEGRLVEDVQPMTDLSLSCVAEQDGRRESNRYAVSGRCDMAFYTAERLERLVREAVGRTLVLFEASPAPAGEMPVVLAAGSSGILLHEAIGHGMEADFNRKGISIFADRIGKPVAKPFVSIVDDGTLEHVRGSINVDDEGCEASRTVLVENGVLASYLHDQISARHYRVRPTGSGRRQSYAYPPLPRMRTTYMLPGPHKPEEIVASIKKGVFCETFTNGQVRIGAGDFSFYVKNGYLIEDGKRTRPIKDVNLIGNGPKVLEAVDMVADDYRVDEGGYRCGKDGQWVPVSLGMPTVRVASLTVGGRGQT